MKDQIQHGDEDGIQTHTGNPREPLKVLGKLIINVSYEKKIRTDFRYTYLRSAV